MTSTFTADRSDLNASPLDEAEPPARRQPGQLVELFLDGADDWAQVRIVNRDRIAYEMTAARHKEWPPLEVGQNFAMTFVCWQAAKRTGLTAVTFEQFQNVLVDYNVIPDAPADPTRTTALPDGT